MSGGPDYAGRNVVAGRGLLSVPGKGMVPCEALHAGEVCRAAAAQQADVILVHGEALDLWGLPAQLAGRKDAERRDQLRATEFITGAAAAGWQIYDERESGWRVRLKAPEGGRWFSLVFLPYDVTARAVTGPWRAAATYSELVLGLSRFAHTVGLAWRDGVGRTAERLILSTHPPEKGGVMLEKSPTIPEPARLRVEQPYHWRRQLTAAEVESSTWVHVYDANAQYLAAWISGEFGFGEPAPAVEWAPNLPGLWKIDRAWDGFKRASDPLLPAACFDDETEWFFGPTVARLIELVGEVPPLLDGYIWPHRSRFLRVAGERLRDARSQLAPHTDQGAAAALARDAIKAIYKVESGRFAMARRDEMTGWHRPDWEQIIKSTARTNLHRRLAGTNGGPRSDPRAALLAPPFCIEVDAMLIPAWEADPVVFAETIGVPLGDNLGQFKVLASCRLDRGRVDVLHDIMASTTAVRKIVATVKDWAELDAGEAS